MTAAVYIYSMKSSEHQGKKDKRGLFILNVETYTNFRGVQKRKWTQNKLYDYSIDFEPVSWLC